MGASEPNREIARLFRETQEAMKALTQTSVLDLIQQNQETVRAMTQNSVQQIIEQNQEAVRALTQNSVQQIIEQNQEAVRALTQGDDLSRIVRQAQEIVGGAYLPDIAALREDLSRKSPEELRGLADEMQAEPEPSAEGVDSSVKKATTAIDQLILALLLAAARFAGDFSPSPTQTRILDALAVLLLLRAVLSTLNKRD